jgi:hypothetical protein
MDGHALPGRGGGLAGFTSSQVNRIRALPRPYGVHITVGDALEYPAAVLPEVASRLEGIAAQVAPFVLKGASYDSTTGIPSWPCAGRRASTTCTGWPPPAPCTSTPCATA